MQRNAQAISKLDPMRFKGAIVKALERSKEKLDDPKPLLRKQTTKKLSEMLRSSSTKKHLHESLSRSSKTPRSPGRSPGRRASISLAE